MKDKKFKVGDVYKFQGVRNSDTREIDGGWLWIVTEIDKDGHAIRRHGYSIRNARNRQEAIKMYREKNG